MRLVVRSLFLAKRALASVGIHVAKYPFSHQEAFMDSMNMTLANVAGGVLHLGAHTGQEADLYNDRGLRVIWVEAIPDIFLKLQANISSFTNQIAVCAILGDENDQNIIFNISSNDAVSSSIFEINDGNLRDSFEMVSQLVGVTTRLDKLFDEATIRQHSHWVVDLQGAELIALKGAGGLLKFCNSMYVEVSTRSIYNGGARWEILDQFLKENGFFALWHPRHESHENVLYIRAISS